MTPFELIRFVMDGHLILVAEFRGGKVESAGYVDKETGEAIKTLQLAYAVERRGRGMIENVLLRRYLQPDVTADQVEIKLEKGRIYAFALDKFEAKRGMMFGRMTAQEPMLIDEG
jgi:hypothetical protein